jgi:hypothetical protein
MIFEAYILYLNQLQNHAVQSVLSVSGIWDLHIWCGLQIVAHRWEQLDPSCVESTPGTFPAVIFAAKRLIHVLCRDWIRPERPKKYA